MYDLKSFLRSIDPDKTIWEAERRADQAFNSFDPGSWSITDHDDFENCLSRFYWHVESHILRTTHMQNPNPEYTRGMARDVLSDLYGTRGHNIAFDMSRHGIDGGLYRVLKDFAAKRASYHGNNWISTRVSQFYNALTIDEEREAAKEYVREYGHLLPSEYTKGEATYVQVRFYEILQGHPELMIRMRQVGRT